MPRRLSIRALPLATSRNTQPSTVGSRATSGLGGAPDAGGAAGGVAAAACCGIVPVTSFAGAGAAAAVVVDAWAARSLSTVSLSLASFAAGSACAFSTLSRRSLALLGWPLVVLAVLSRRFFYGAILAICPATPAPLGA